MYDLQKNAKKETMTSRQRVINAIEHKPIDRMPIDLGMHFSSGIPAFAYWNLREYLGMSTDKIEVVDPIQFLARVDEEDKWTVEIRNSKINMPSGGFFFDGDWPFFWR